ncbi:hypothetical protein EP331_06515 [bacterium]|nr:MAG: hypothetical protein EP331_06515 [bacterium]
MNNDRRQLLILLVLNALLAFALAIGIQNTVKIVDFISGITFSSIVELKNIVFGKINLFLAKDIKIIAGTFLALGIIFYDLITFFKWLTSFKFTTAKACNSCSKKIIREHRRTGDRILSAIYPVARFRCVGCGQEYLKHDTGHHHTHDHVIVNQVETEKISI